MRCTAVAVVCFVAAAPIGLFAQQPTFKSGVEAVRLDVAVTRGGKPIHGLTTRDFSIRDNGVRQRVESVSSVDAGPLNVLMVLDTSRSVSGHRLMDLVDAGRGLLAALRPADRAALITFSASVEIRVPLTLDRTVIDTTLTTLAGAGGTAIHDAVWAALQLRGEDEARPLILVFSDGIDTASWLSAPDIVLAARHSGMVIHAVGLMNERTIAPTDRPVDTLQALRVVETNMQARSRPSVLLEQLTGAAGGRHWSAASSDELRKLFARALDEMRARYVVTFYPEGVEREGWHDVKVAVTVRGDVATRPGYFVPAR